MTAFGVVPALELEDRHVRLGLGVEKAMSNYRMFAAGLKCRVAKEFLAGASLNALRSRTT